ncbi:hypothetical protein [Flavobacterium algicola]|uniref:hypothetical protein n=1 Tax=Flavobacterium algicola TaxID=556529 RepID=UPI001EFD15C3|nr:hypothetical protein [Flavobacterium algicola]MCG9793735.1 hypothetical protein [Flavobacterium algicola]
MNTVSFQGSAFYSPAQTQSPDGFITPNYALNQANAMASNINEGQVPQQIHLTHTNLPSWMITANPNIGAYPRAVVHYDIDYPGLATYNQNMMVPFVSQIVSKAGTTPLVHVIMNEPHWELEQGAPGASTGVSEYTYLKFESFLQSKYGTIANLNVVYAPFNGNVNFASFKADIDKYTCSLQTVNRGTPSWYDWCRFNMDRVNA